MSESESSDTDVQLARHLGLFEATMIGVGAMIGAGIFVLTGLAAGNAGPAAVVAFGLNGVVTLFTALSYAELSSAIPEAGGGYSFVKKVMPNPVAFMAGWMLWFAYVVACSLYAKGFGSYFLHFFGKYLPVVSDFLVGWFGHELAVTALTLLAGLFFVVINIIGAGASGQAENVMTIGKILILSIFIGFGVLAIFRDPVLTKNNFTPFMPMGVSGIVSAMGLTFIAFEGYDLIATVSEEVKDPQTTIPKAILYSLGITVAVYLLVVFVAIGAVPPADGTPTWQLLGNRGELGIVEAAGNFMPNWGVVVVLVGGLFATLSALNATVLASSRVAFSMGRDWMLPNVLSEIHSSRKTPVVAISLSGALFLGVATFFPLQTIGMASSLLFLMTFGLVNVSMILYRSRREGDPPPFQVPFHPLVPVLGVMTCLGLAVYQLIHQPVAATIAIGWSVIGVMIYLVFFSKRARVADVTSVMESPELRTLKKMKNYRVLLSVSNPERLESLVTLAGFVARSNNGDVLGVNVVDLPGITSYSEASPYLDSSESILRRARKQAVERGIDFSTMLRVARQPGSEIMDTARQNECDLILMGYKKEDPLENGVIHAVARHQPCDLAVLKNDGLDLEEVESVVVPVRGRETHDPLKARLIHGVRDATNCDVRFLTVVSPEDDHTSEGAHRRLDQVRKLFDLPGAKTTVNEHSNPDDAIVESVGERDLVMLGMREEPWLESFFFGSMTQRIASRVKGPVLLTKAHQKRVSWMKSWFGADEER